MELTVFGTRPDGCNFDVFSTHLKRKDGASIYVRVKFKQDCGQPSLKDCPCNIVVERSAMNLSEKPAQDKQTKEFITDKNGEVVINRTLWISDWKKSKTPYVDHSLDDYEVD